MGSANFTTSGFTSNIEWDYATDFEVNSRLDGRSLPYDIAVEQFDDLFNNHAIEPDDAFLENYIAVRGKGNAFAPFRPLSRQYACPVAPLPAQEEALASLRHARKSGKRKFFVVAPPGIGKTLIAAFDVRTAGSARVLFIAHREIILRQAMNSFRMVFPDAQQVLVQGTESLRCMPRKGPVHVFAMIQTIGTDKNAITIGSNHFDYVVVDEFHHAAASQYRSILGKVLPGYLLGLTATPERTDGQDVLAICDRTVAYDLTLFDAIDAGWLCPFQFYAIYDSTDYDKVRWTGVGYDEGELERALSTDTRAELIVRNLRRFQPVHGKRKCVAFCSNVGHARWMAAQFQMHGFASTCIVGTTSDEDRAHLLERLACEDDELQVVCTVDVLTEGVDVPSLTHVLLLRPTQSFIVFLQQLGRGLRLHRDKPFVTVLDFVGNFKKSFVSFLSLNGFRSVPLQLSKSLTSTDFHPPAGCHISVHTRVRRIWDDEIRTTLKRVSPVDRIRFLLEELIEDEGSTRKLAKVSLPEFF